MAPSNCTLKYLPLAAAGSVKCLRYQATPKKGRRAIVRIDLAVEGTFDGPIVGQVERAPGGVAESGLLGAVGFAFEEAPVVADADAPVGADLDFRGGRGGEAGEAEQQGRGCEAGAGDVSHNQLERSD